MPHTQFQQALGFIYRERKLTSIKPKKNIAAYLLFSNKMRILFKQDNTELAPNEAMKRIAKLWKEIKPEEKSIYQDLARKDKERYLQEKKDFLLAHPSETLVNRTKKNHVRKPCSGYGFFVKKKSPQVREENPNLEAGDILKKIAKEWKNLSEQQRNVYKEMGANDKERKIKKLKKIAQGGALSNVHIFVEDLREEEEVEEVEEDNNKKREVNQPTKKIKGIDDQSNRTQPTISSPRRSCPVLSEHFLYSEEDEIYETFAVNENIDSDEQNGSSFKSCYYQNCHDTTSLFFNKKPIDLSNLNPDLYLHNENDLFGMLDIKSDISSGVDGENN